MDPYISLINDIATQFEMKTKKDWLTGKRHGATAFLPDGKANTRYPHELRRKFPNGVIAQESIPGAGFWDFGVEMEGTEFDWTYTLNGHDGRKVRHTERYRVVVELNSNTVHNYRARGGK